MPQSGYTKRTLLVALGGIVSGCVGGSGGSDETEVSTPTATSRYDCGGEYQTATEMAAQDYHRWCNDLGSVRGMIGSIQQLRVDPAFSNGNGFAKLSCNDPNSDCDTEFLDAIEIFREAKSVAESTQEGFRGLKEYVNACEVEEPQLFVEESDKGIEAAARYIEATNSFIKSAQRHVDEDLSEFQPGDHFSNGLDTYRSAQNISLMSPDELEQRATVYNG